MIDDLQKIGFTQNEAIIFMALVKHSPCHVATLVQETKKHRQIVYNALDDIKERNLVSISKRNGKNLYTINDASQILTSIKQTEIVAEHIVTNLNSMIESNDEHAHIYLGTDGYAQALMSFRKNAEVAKEYIVYGGQAKEWFGFTKRIMDHHVQEMERLSKIGVDIFALFFKEEWESSKDVFEPYINNPYITKLAKNRSIPDTVWIAGDNIYILTPVAEPIVVHIESPLLAKKYRDHFWKHWLKAEHIKGIKQKNDA